MFAEPQGGFPGPPLSVKLTDPLASEFELNVPFNVKLTAKGAGLGLLTEKLFPEIATLIVLIVTVKSPEQPPLDTAPPKDKEVIRFPETVNVIAFPCPVLPDQFPSLEVPPESVTEKVSVLEVPAGVVTEI